MPLSAAVDAAQLGSGGLLKAAADEGDDDDDDGPDRAVTIGRVLRDFFPLGGGKQGAGAGGAQQQQQQQQQQGGGRFAQAGATVSGRSDGSDETGGGGSSSGGGGQLVLVRDNGTGRYGLGINADFVGNLGSTPRTAAARLERRRFQSISDFARHLDRCEARLARVFLLF